MTKIASSWSSGIVLSISSVDQEYITKILEDLGISNDYPVEKKSIGIYKAGFSSKESDKTLLSYKDKLIPVLSTLLPLSLTSKEIKIIVPWNTQLNEIVWFEIVFQDSKMNQSIAEVRNQLTEILSPITDEVNMERNKEFAPHITLIYKLTSEIKSRIESSIPEEIPPGTLEERLNNFLKYKNYLPHIFNFEHAEFYLTRDERVRIV